MNSIPNISQENIINYFNSTSELLNPQSSPMTKKKPINIENRLCCLKKPGRIKGKKYGNYSKEMKNLVVTEIRQHDQSVKKVAQRYDIPPRTIYTWLNRPDISDQRPTLVDINGQLRIIEKSIATAIRKSEDCLKQALEKNILIQKYIYDLTHQPSNVARSNLQYFLVKKTDDPTKDTANCAICDDIKLYNSHLSHIGETVDFHQLATNLHYFDHVQQRYSTAYRLFDMLDADNKNITELLEDASHPPVMANTLATPASD